jgi:hypothetical protein
MGVGASGADQSLVRQNSTRAAAFSEWRPVASKLQRRTVGRKVSKKRAGKATPAAVGEFPSPPASNLRLTMRRYDRLNEL